MYSVSDRFLNTIRKSGKRKTVVDVYRDSLKVLSDLPVVSGSLKVDRDGRTRRSGSMVVGDPTLFPRFNSDLLAPYSTEVVIKQGLTYTDGSEELVPLGVFIVNDVNADEATGLIPSIEFFDRAQRVFETSTHVIEGTEKTLSGMTVSAALESVLLYPAPGWPHSPLWGLYIDPTLTNPRIPGGQFDGYTDRWQLVLDLVEMIGAECYFDRSGTAVVKPIPGITADTTSADAVWIVNCGENGVMLSAEQRITRDDTYNSIVMLGATPDGTTRQARAIVYDLNPASLTYWHGPFGKKTLRLQNERLVTDSQCLIAAQAKLKEALGLAKHVHFGSLCNPALDDGDIILLVYPDGTEELHILDSFDVPFGDGKMTATTRTIQLAVA